MPVGIAQTKGALMACHDTVERIETLLFGPSPTDNSKRSEPGCLDMAIIDTLEYAQHLDKRLMTLFNRLSG